MSVLVAGIGNIFNGDDGFGVEVVQRLLKRPPLEGVEVKDFGIRGLDLTYALQKDFDAVVLVDATARGSDPGTLYVIEPLVSSATHSLEPHGMDPHRVLALARSMGAPLKTVRLVGCEPASVGGNEGVMGLSPQVEMAVEPAIELISSLVRKLGAQGDA